MRRSSILTPLMSSRPPNTCAAFDDETQDQKMNFMPICSSRIGFLVLVIEPYVELVNVVLGSFQIGLFNTLNPSSRTCRVLLLIIRKFRMIDASTLKMPGPRNVLRPTLPKVPSGCSTNAAVLNHCAVD